MYQEAEGKLAAAGIFIYFLAMIGIHIKKKSIVEMEEAEKAL